MKLKKIEIVQSDSEKVDDWIRERDQIVWFTK